MIWIVRYDQWIFHLLEALLLWLEEWFSISQKRAEQGMILLYVLLYMPSPFWNFIVIPAKFLCAGSVGYFMWTLHRRPDFVRKSSREDQTMVVIRIVLRDIIWFHCRIYPLPGTASMDRSSAGFGATSLCRVFLCNQHYVGWETRTTAEDGAGGAEKNVWP